MIKLLENDPRPIPTLFMYTRRDTLLCPDSMSRFVEKRKSGGFHIEPVVYDDCDHVSIYLKHPEDYFNRIRKHLLFSKMDLKTLLQDTDLNSIKK
jgi:pimeloyl-ACP methyl ester carboxylesterase